ncbi:peptidoglycan-binding protein [Kitasatospora sp. NPDC059646]|uniref:C40 family peptidase n=1 Tax=Kitasatospora sp. NPDC059646 TaxID=3346893 RepID=UPI0036CBE711
MARSQVGYREGRYGSGSYNNDQKYSKEVPGLEWSNFQPWCATFCSWVAMRASVSHLFPRTASCLTGVAWFKDKGRWSAYPAIGAQVFYGNNGGTHTGLVYAYDADYIYSIEGNTNDSGSPEGVGVFLRKRARRDGYVYGYGLPAYAEGVTTADPALKGRAGFAYSATASDPNGGSSGTSARTVIVRAGQTLGAIAAAAGISLASLLSVNPDLQSHPDVIHPGDTVTIPPTAPTQPPATSPSTSTPPASGSGSNAGSSSSVPSFPGTPFRYTAGRAPVYSSAVKKWQAQMAARGWSISVDGYYGPASASVAKRFQAEKGLMPDSVVGPLTWRAAWTAPVT